MGENKSVLEKTRRQGRDHWQDEKERLAAALEKKILGRRTETALRDILATPLPDLLKVAFRNHALSVLRSERPLVLQSSHRFVLDDQQIRTHLRTLRDLLTDRLLLTREEVRRLVSLGVRLQFDLITKPRATLEIVPFSKSTERQRDEILAIIASLGEQRPMIGAVLDLVEECPSGPVTKDAFAVLCRRAERMVYGKKPVTALIADMQDFISFCAAGESKRRTEIDNQTVLGMLFERNLKELAESLLPTLTQRDTWTVAQIEQVLEHQIVADGLTLSDDEPTQLFLPADVDLSEFLEETKRQVQQRFQGEDSGPQTAGCSPAAGVALNAEAEAASTKRAEAASWVRPVSLHSATDSEQQLLVRHEDIEHQPPGPYPSLHLLIDEKARKVFIKKLFGKDSSAYFDFVGRLEAAPNWKSAKAMMDAELVARGINPYLKAAVRLSDVVFSRYFARR